MPADRSGCVLSGSQQNDIQAVVQRRIEKTVRDEWIQRVLARGNDLRPDPCIKVREQSPLFFTRERRNVLQNQTTYRATGKFESRVGALP